MQNKKGKRTKREKKRKKKGLGPVEVCPKATMEIIGKNKKTLAKNKQTKRGIQGKSRRREKSGGWCWKSRNAVPCSDMMLLSSIASCTSHFVSCRGVAR